MVNVCKLVFFSCVEITKFSVFYILVNIHNLIYIYSIIMKICALKYTRKRPRTNALLFFGSKSTSFSLLGVNMYGKIVKRIRWKCKLGLPQCTYSVKYVEIPPTNNDNWWNSIKNGKHFMFTDAASEKKTVTKQELHVIHHWFSLVVFKRSKISVLLLWEFESDIMMGFLCSVGFFF